MDEILSKLAGLVTVKSLVTILLTTIFCVKEINGGISSDFMTVYAVVISFYFGTQVGRENAKQTGKTN